MKQEDCPFKDMHTPYPEFPIWDRDAKLRYMDMLEKTHKQIACQGCGYFALWVLKTTIKTDNYTLVMG